MFNSRLTVSDRIAMGERVRAARYVAQLSMRELGIKCGVSLHTVQNWERGSVPRDAIIRGRVCDVLGVDEGVLFAEWVAIKDQARAVIAS